MKFKSFFNCISTNDGRLTLSFKIVAIVFVSVFAGAFIVALFIEGISNFESAVSEIFQVLFTGGLLLFLVLYLSFSIVHVIKAKIIPEWNFRKDIRLWCFGSLLWVAGVYLFVSLFDPFDGYMNNKILFMFSPPLFAGLAKCIYDKYIKYGIIKTEDSVVQECKIIIDCPVCKKKMRIPSNMNIVVSCPSCSHTFQVKNGMLLSKH